MQLLISLKPFKLTKERRHFLEGSTLTAVLALWRTISLELLWSPFLSSMLDHGYNREKEVKKERGGFTCNCWLVFSHLNSLRKEDIFLKEAPWLQFLLCDIQKFNVVPCNLTLKSTSRPCRSSKEENRWAGYCYFLFLEMALVSGWADESHTHQNLHIWGMAQDMQWNLCLKWVLGWCLEGIQSGVALTGFCDSCCSEGGLIVAVSFKYQVVFLVALQSENRIH